MATVIAQSERPSAPGAAGAFQPNHAWDRNFFLLYTGLIWLGILMGFGTDLVHHFKVHETPYPLIVHFHAAAFVGWLLLFTTQVLLIRTKRWDVHRKLGLAMTGLATIMVVLGPATAYIVDASQMGTPAADPSFLSVQLSDIFAFGPLVAAAVLLRGRPAFHKRLILLATVYISDAGYARWLGDAIGKVAGGGFWGFYAPTYLPTAILFLGIGLYDLITRRRLHPAYLAGLAWVYAMQLAGTALYLNPAWKVFTTHLLGH